MSLLRPGVIKQHQSPKRYIFASSWKETFKFTFKVQNFWKFTYKLSGWISGSCCSLKPLWSGMGEVVPVSTSLTQHPPSPPTPPLGDKVSMLTHIYPHKAGGRLKWSYAKSPGWHPTLCVASCLICWFALAYKKYGHTWHRMSLLRPGVIKQHKPLPLCCNYPVYKCPSASIVMTSTLKGSHPFLFQ